MTDKILQVNELVYEHVSTSGLFKPKQRFVLGPISFSVDRGQTIAIIGNNGSGKTMLARTLAGAITPHFGRIEFLANTAKLANTAYPIRLIVQHNKSAMNPAISVGDMMQNTMSADKQLTNDEKQEKIEQTLIKVGLLREHYYFYRHMLSDGQQQRIALARALLLNPSIIVADEPFAALDPSVRSQTINLILELQKELGLGFVFVSHNLGIARHMSDNIIVMDKGKIIEKGLTEQVFSNPQHAITKTLIDTHYTMLNKHRMLDQHI